MQQFKWGILGLGRIAGIFAEGLAKADNAVAYACGSRSIDKAREFGERYNVAKCYGSYEELVADDDVDAIYVATPHTLHMPNTLLALSNKKPVLCEKPIAVTFAETKAMVDAAKANNTFLMEAHWTRFLPVMRKVVEWIDSGRIGEPRMIKCDFGFRAGWDPSSRILNNSYAGGGLLDVGVYCLSIAEMVFGNEIADITSVGHVGESDVDEQAAMLLKWNGGEIAMVSCGVRTSTEQSLHIYGTDGFIHVPDFWHCQKATVYGAKEETYSEWQDNGYQFEANEVMRCVKAGAIESALMPHAASLAIMEWCDKFREQWGLVYKY